MKVSVSSLNEVPEALRTEYEERDGKFFLKLEGDPSGYVKASEFKGKVAEFRNRNTELLKGVAELAGVPEAIDLTPIKEKLSKFDGVDPAEYKELKAKAEELKKKGVKTADDIQAKITSAIESAIAPVRQELESEKKARVEAQTKADDALLRQTIGDRYIKAGGKPSALDFIVIQAKNTFRVVDNGLKAKDTKFSSINPGELIEVDEWLSQAMKEYDFAFAPSKGGGADPKPGDPKFGVKQLVNPTPQELGRHSKEIREGKLQIVTDSQ
jgi:hypothetical protein